MGEVYKARDTRLDRTVAIKVLPSHFSQNAEMKARLEREARTIGGLNHPHICTPPFARARGKFPTNVEIGTFHAIGENAASTIFRFLSGNHGTRFDPHEVSAFFRDIPPTIPTFSFPKNPFEPFQVFPPGWRLR